MDPLIGELLLRELSRDSLGYVVTNQDGIISAAYGDPRLFRECDPVFIGSRLVDAVPELVGNEDTLAAIVRGSADRLQLDMINREDDKGQPIFVRITDFPYRTSSGEIEGVLHLIEDITETATQQHAILQQRSELALIERKLSRTARRLSSANKALRKIDQFRRNFVETAAHQISEPLTAIEGFSELLIDGAFGSLSDKQAEQVEVISASSLQLQRIVSSLMDIVAIEANQLLLEIRPTNLDELLREALAILQPEISQKQIQLTLEIHDDLPLAFCAEHQTLIVLQNLLRFAIDCTQNHSQLKVRLYGDLTQQLIQLEIELFNTAIDTLAIQRIANFETLRTFPRVGNQSNNTLDLYTTQALMQLQDGQFYIKTSGEGMNTAILRFPIHSTEN